LSLVVDEHREYLADAARIAAFRRALGRTIRSGDVVVDIGAGTAILGMLACEAGAARVYSIDDGGIVELARELVRANQFENRLTVVKGLSTRISLPERAHVVVADQIGRFGFEAGVLEYFADAHERLLKPGARAVPSAISLVVALVEHPATWRRIAFWSKQPAGFSYEPARLIAQNTGYPTHLLPGHLLGKPAIGATLDTLTHGARPIRFEQELRATRAGTLHGIGGWFSAQLAPRVELTNSPLSRQRIGRRNVVFPIARPVKLAQGDRVRVSFSILPKETLVSWTVEVHAASARPAARFTHSTLKGMLICREDMAHTRPDFVPVMSPWGKARQTVLELCDGKRTLREIEEGVLRGHSDLFPGRAEAAAFTAEVVTRYAT
jgi:protein arginine N-methyltransferase 1